MPISRRSERTIRKRSKGRVKICVSLGLAVLAAGVLATASGGTAGASTAGSASATDQTNPTTTPVNEPALDAAAADAQTIAGSQYFTSTTVDIAVNTVTVYLASAPQSIINQLTALHPATYIIDNTSAHPLSYLDALQQKINDDEAQLQTSGIAYSYLEPTSDGHLEVGVRSNMATAVATLSAGYGGDALQFVQDNSPLPIAYTYRYSDVSPWNGGDFIYYRGSASNWADCSSGIPVYNQSNPSLTYMLTASHCFFSYGNKGIGAHVLNGYVRSDTNDVYSGSSKTEIGQVKYDSDLTGGGATLDVALVPASSSDVDFDSAWNSQGRAVQVGVVSNSKGDPACSSGAFDGQICSLTVQGADLTQNFCLVDVTPCPSGDVYTVDHLVKATAPSGQPAGGPGDSGGPVYSYNGSNLEARGMVEGGQNDVSCSSVPPGTSGRKCGNLLWYVGMVSIDSGFNVSPITG